MEHCLIFSREMFYVTIVLCLNILWLKAITARQTWTSLRKYDVIKVCSIEYLTTQIELPVALRTFKSWTVHKIMEYLTLGLLSSLWNIYHGTTAYFFWPPVDIYLFCVYRCDCVRRFWTPCSRYSTVSCTTTSAPSGMILIAPRRVAIATRCRHRRKFHRKARCSRGSR